MLHGVAVGVGVESGTARNSPSRCACSPYARSPRRECACHRQQVGFAGGGQRRVGQRFDGGRKRLHAAIAHARGEQARGRGGGVARIGDGL
jgi:hypothetical protein